MATITDKAYELARALQRFNLSTQVLTATTGDFSSGVAIGTANIVSGSGSPEGVVTAPVGSLYLRLDGGTSTTLYVKETGTGNTGWVAK